MPFKKGQSGNPSGRPPLTPEVREAEKMAREFAPEAMRRLMALTGSEDPQVALRACEAVLNRALGKPRETVDLNVGSVEDQVRGLPDDDLAAALSLVGAAIRDAEAARKGGGKAPH